MEPRTLSFLAASCAGTLVGGEGGTLARGLSTDSRSIRPGDLFVALAGERFDGHDFLVDVRAKGAVAVLLEANRRTALPPGHTGILVADTRRALGAIARAYRQAFPVEAIAVAGSNGKTTTKELLRSVLGATLPVTASAASFNNDIGVPLSLLALDSSHRAGVFEAGTNHPGELRPLLEMIGPTAGVITSIGREHLEHFGDLAGVLAEEGTLAELLPAHGFLVIQGDGYGAQALAARTAARVIRVGTGPENDWRILQVALAESGTRFLLASGDARYNGEYHTHLFGAHQVRNATYAVAVGRELGLNRAEIQRGLDSCRGAKMRLQLRHLDDFLVLDDAYNANADSMQAALETLSQFPCRGRRIAVLGDMAELGPSAIPAHQEVGRRAAERQIDCLVAVGSSSAWMAGAARVGGLRDVIDLPEVAEAGPAVAGLVRPGDVILVKASRTARLERVIEFLATRFPETARAERAED